ncbi:hypothetical protein [Pedobacter nototheniae]|uniref:hypothetical protein n=1 Tax=Pedobacter nototheniae TaxID=2488994 RepID=UPI0013F3FEA1|nr:hypothetical protein [Pedobacter nototheniae]
MEGVVAAFSSNEKVEGTFGAHSNASFVKDVGAFLKSWQNNKVDNKKIIDDFVRKKQA